MRLMPCGLFVSEERILARNRAAGRVRNAILKESPCGRRVGQTARVLLASVCTEANCVVMH